MNESFRRVCNRFMASRERKTAKALTIRDGLEAERELNDALIARVMMLESRLDPDAGKLMAEWTGIENGIKSPEAKIKALHLLFGSLAIQYSRLALQHSKPVDKLDRVTELSVPITVETSPGELIDRLTILEIKLAHIADAAKVKNVRHEYGLLTATLVATLPPSDLLNGLRAELKAVNEALWKIEDDIRDLERSRNFGESFVSLARSVYRTNDQRAALKRRINELLASGIVEEKSYTPY